jgi:metal-sulfur cluster biosynthetic enzyme
MEMRDQIIEKLKTCFDPEIPVNIYDLGLVYEIEVEGERADIMMTFTSESCPSAREIPVDMRRKVVTLDGIEVVDIDIVFDPPWHPRMISDEAKKELGIDEDTLEE